MVNVGNKAVTAREARAEAVVRVGAKIARLIAGQGGLAKGGVVETARIAGMMAAKRTADLIPMCHPVPIDHIRISIVVSRSDLVITTEVGCHGVTGVEMEALTAAAVAALTVYDMCKSADKGIEIRSVRLLEKKGGKSGHWRAAPVPSES